MSQSKKIISALLLVGGFEQAAQAEPISNARVEITEGLDGHPFAEFHYSIRNDHEFTLCLAMMDMHMGDEPFEEYPEIFDSHGEQVSYGGIMGHRVSLYSDAQFLVFPSEEAEFVMQLTPSYDLRWGENYWFTYSVVAWNCSTFNSGRPTDEDLSDEDWVESHTVLYSSPRVEFEAREASD